MASSTYVFENAMVEGRRRIARSSTGSTPLPYDASTRLALRQADHASSSGLAVARCASDSASLVFRNGFLSKSRDAPGWKLPSSQAKGGPVRT